MFDAVMHSSFSLYCASLPLFYSGRGCLVDIITNVSWSAVCCVVISMCSLFSSPRSSITWFITFSISVTCSVLSSLLRRKCPPPAGTVRLGDPHEQSDQVSVQGRDALHICSAANRLPVGWLLERSKQEPGSFVV